MNKNPYFTTLFISILISNILMSMFPIGILLGFAAIVCIICLIYSSMPESDAAEKARHERYRIAQLYDSY